METIEVYTVTLPHYFIDTVTTGQPYPLGSIKAGAEGEFCGGFAPWDMDFNIHGFVLIATLKSNETVLDQAVLTFQ